MRFAGAVILGVVLSFVACDDGVQPVAPPVEITASVQHDSINVGHVTHASATMQNATDKRVFWWSATPQIAHANETGAIAGVRPGTAVIMVASVQDLSRRAAVSVVVKAGPSGTVPTAQIIPAEATVVIGAQLPLITLGFREHPLTWQSSAPLVATVNEKGLVTAHAVGTAIIRATAANLPQVSAASVITVQAPPR